MGGAKGMMEDHETKRRVAMGIAVEAGVECNPSPAPATPKVAG
jgi:hypothetical protein